MYVVFHVSRQCGKVLPILRATNPILRATNPILSRSLAGLYYYLSRSETPKKWDGGSIIIDYLSINKILKYNILITTTVITITIILIFFTGFFFLERPNKLTSRLMEI